MLNFGQNLPFHRTLSKKPKFAFSLKAPQLIVTGRLQLSRKEYLINFYQGKGESYSLFNDYCLANNEIFFKELHHVSDEIQTVLRPLQRVKPFFHEEY